MTPIQLNKCWQSWQKS